MIKIEELDDFTQGYIKAALFTSPDDEDPKSQNLINFYNINNEDLKEIILECGNFQKTNKELIEQAISNSKSYSFEQAGIDFWLTRNGHGAGFWDRDLEEVGDKLTTKASELKVSDLYIGDDNKLYFTNLPKDRKNLSLKV